MKIDTAILDKLRLDVHKKLKGKIFIHQNKEYKIVKCEHSDFDEVFNYNDVNHTVYATAILSYAQQDGEIEEPHKIKINIQTEGFELKEIESINKMD